MATDSVVNYRSDEQRAIREQAANVHPDPWPFHRPTPKPATVEPAMWAPVKMITLEQLNEQYPEPAEKCGACGLASWPNHRCPSQALLDAWRAAPNGSRLFEHTPGVYGLHTPVKLVEAHPVPTTEPPEWKGATDICPKCGKSLGTYDPCVCWRKPTSPLDRALSDFIARRKAKREQPADTVPKCTHCGLQYSTWEASMAHAGPCGHKHRSAARAMSHPVTLTARMGGRT